MACAVTAGYGAGSRSQSGGGEGEFAGNVFVGRDGHFLDDELAYFEMGKYRVGECRCETA